MSKRDAALMKRSLQGLSPEEYAKKHSAMVFFYSARSIRRWLDGKPMPTPVRDRLTTTHKESK